jgi:hypothetical protein
MKNIILEEMSMFRQLPRPGNPGKAPAPLTAPDIVRRFFSLIERFERPMRRLEHKAAPERKARITRIDDEMNRKSLR